MRRLPTRGIGVLLAAVAMIAGAGPGTARAGLADSPLPVMDPSAHTSHLFSIPGVIKNNNIETVFLCTSMERSRTVLVGVEVFPASGGAPLNDASQVSLRGVLSVGPGVTVTIATGATVALHEDLLLSLPPAGLRNGSARIIATSRRIVCTAFLVDQLNDPPSVMAPLKLIGKTKQRGE